MKIRNKSSEKVTIIVIVIVIIAFTGWLVYNHYKPAPVYPLGDSSKLEFVGSSHYGCWWACDANPTDIYYYATDMSVEEVVRYFKKAHIDSNDPPSTHNDPSLPITITLLSDMSGGFYITYHHNGQKVMEDFNLKKTTKQHILAIQDRQYTAAQNAL